MKEHSLKVVVKVRPHTPFDNKDDRLDVLRVRLEEPAQQLNVGHGVGGITVEGGSGPGGGTSVCGGSGLLARATRSRGGREGGTKERGEADGPNDHSLHGRKRYLVRNGLWCPSQLHQTEPNAADLFTAQRDGWDWGHDVLCAVCSVV
jgi:hypothetical protein